MSSTEQSGDSSSDRDVEFYFRPGIFIFISSDPEKKKSWSDAGEGDFYVDTGSKIGSDNLRRYLHFLT